jgi:hypothetical protein
MASTPPPSMIGKTAEMYDKAKNIKKEYMKIYIIWNKLDDRPVVNRNEFGNLLIYLTKEQAQAYKMDYGYLNKEEIFDIKEAEILLK